VPFTFVVADCGYGDNVYEVYETSMPCYTVRLRAIISMAAAATAATERAYA